MLYSDLIVFSYSFEYYKKCRGGNENIYMKNSSHPDKQQ